MKYINKLTNEIDTEDNALDESGALLDDFVIMTDEQADVFTAEKSRSGEGGHVVLTDEQAAMIPTEAEIENSIASMEITWALREITKHDHGHGRVLSNVQALKTYCNAWRDRVIDGVIVGARPVRPE